MTIDTVKVHIKEYSIQDSSNIQVQPGRFTVGTGEKLSEFPLFRDNIGRQFIGSKAFLNNDKWNLTIQPNNYSPSGTGCYLHFSIPKLYYGDNYYSVGEEGSQTIFNQVEKELWENGIHTNLNNADLSRIDTFKNIQTLEPFSSYFSLFSLLKARRAVQRGYGTTFLLSNSQREYCIYDKNVEMQNRGIEVSKYPNNTMRFENRMLNKRTIQNSYGFSTVKELFSGGYPVMKQKQLEQWEKNLFCYSVSEVVLLGSRQLEQEMKVFKEKFTRNWFEQFLKSYGSYYLAEVAGVEVVKLALSNLETERTKVWRTVKVLETAKRELDFVKKEQGSRKTLGTLYEELKQKVCLN